MRRGINPGWQKKILYDLDNGQKIDETQSFLPGIQWLIRELVKRGKPYRMWNLGAGVRRITTDTDSCPCCKRQLEGEP